jgi:hypothetical protein
MHCNINSSFLTFRRPSFLSFPSILLCPFLPTCLIFLPSYLRSYSSFFLFTFLSFRLCLVVFLFHSFVLFTFSSFVPSIGYVISSSISSFPCIFLSFLFLCVFRLLSHALFLYRCIEICCKLLGVLYKVEINASCGRHMCSSVCTSVYPSVLRSLFLSPSINS